MSRYFPIKIKSVSCLCLRFEVKCYLEVISAASLYPYISHSLLGVVIQSNAYLGYFEHQIMTDVIESRECPMNRMDSDITYVIFLPFKFLIHIVLLCLQFHQPLPKLIGFIPAKCDKIFKPLI